LKKPRRWKPAGLSALDATNRRHFMTTFNRTMWANAGYARDYREQADRCVADCHYQNGLFTIYSGKKP
jgi:hypothetical protein